MMLGICGEILKVNFAKELWETTIKKGRSARKVNEVR